jgi:hypothetical protein
MKEKRLQKFDFSDERNQAPTKVPWHPEVDSDRFKDQEPLKNGTKTFKHQKS